MNNVFLEFEDKTFSREEVVAKATSLAGDIKKRVGTKKVVAVRCDRSPEMIFALYAILFSGNAYLPLGVNYPDAFLGYMTDAAEVSLCICDTPKHRVKGLENIVLNTYTYDSEPFVDDTTTPEDIAYVMFTSGTSGKPKGAKISHRAFANRLNWMEKEYPLGEGKILQKTPYTFDVSVWEIFRPLLFGGGLVLLPPGAHTDMEKIADAVVSYEITQVHFVPSVYDVFLDCVQGRTDVKPTHVFLSGESLKPALMKKHFSVFGNEVALHNLYGPTECAVDVTFYDCVGDEKDVPIGRPIDNCQMEIHDDNGKALGSFLHGEIVVYGTPVGSGYLGEERGGFTEDGGYRTGDIGWYDDNGYFYCVGRKDGQIKLHGQRVDPGDVEKYIEDVDFVHVAVVCSTDENNTLTAFVVATERDEEKLRKECALRMPSFMIPSRFVFVDSIPMSENGKRDFNVLKEMAKDYTPFIAERDQEKQKIVIEAMREVLGTDSIRDDDDFFLLGGNSIKAIRLSAVLREKGYFVTVKEIMLKQTVSRIAREMLTVEEKESETERVQTPHTPREFGARGMSADVFDEIVAEYGLENIERIYRTTPLQDGMIYHSLEEVDYPEYVTQMLIKTDPMSKEVVTEAIGFLWARYEVMRTAIVTTREGNWQVLLKNRAPELHFADGGEVDPKEIARQDLKRGFDLKRDTLFRMTVVQYPDKNILVQSCHHIIMDGWSQSIVWDSAMMFCSLLQKGVPYEVLKRKIDDEIARKPHFEDYVVSMQNMNTDKAKAYFKGILDGFDGGVFYPSVGDFFDLPKGKEAERKGVISPSTLQMFLEYTRKRHTTIPALASTIWGIVLGKVTMTNDVVFGNVISGRNGSTKADNDETVGMFINTLPIRVRFTDDTPFLHLLRDVSLQIAESQEYGFLPIGETGIAIGSINVFNNYGRKKGDGFEVIESYDQTNYPLEMELIDESTYECVLRYDENRYTADDVANLMKFLRKAVLTIVADDGVTVGEINILNEEEKLIYAALREKELAQKAVKTNRTFVKPVGKREEAVADSFRSLLAVTEVYRDDDFFDIGGDSIKAIRLSAKLHALGIECTVKDIMTKRTVKEIASVARFSEREDKTEERKKRLTKQPLSYADYGAEDLTEKEFSDIAEKVGAENIERIYHLTPLQEGMFFHTITRGDFQDYITQRIIDIPMMKRERIVQATNLLGTRYDILRTAFFSTNRTIWQVLLKNRRPEVTFLENVKPEEFAKRDLERGFDVEKDNLFRLTFIKNGGRLVVVQCAHHLLLDGWSETILWNKLISYYHRLENGETYDKIAAEVASESLTLPRFEEYVEWLGKQDKAAAKEKYAALLDGFSGVTRYPSQKGNYGVEMGEAGMRRVVFGETLFDGIKKYVQKNEITVPVLAQTVWGVILAKAVGKRDVVFGNVFSGRTGEIDGIEDMIGMFINTVPIRIKYDSETKFSDLTKDVFAQNADAHRYGYLSLGEIGAKLQTITVFENFGKTDSPFAIRYELDQSNYDLEWESEEDGYAYILRYNRNLYDEKEIDRLVMCIERTYRFVLENALCKVEDIGALTAEDEAFFRSVNQSGAYKKDADHSATEPIGAEEKAVAECMGALLCLDKVYREDDFFDLGGDSIKAIRLSVLLREKGYHATVKTILRCATVEKIAACVEKEDEVSVADEPCGEFSLTPTQRDFFERRYPYPDRYVQDFLCRFDGRIDRDKMEKALAYIRKKHALLRARLTDEKTMSVPPYADEKPCEFVSAEMSEESIKKYCETVRENLSLKGELFKAVCFVGGNKGYLYLCAHHLIIDSVSWTILSGDLVRAYRLEEEPNAEKAATSYRTYANLCEKGVTVAEYETDYWKAVEEKIVAFPKKDAAPFYLRHSFDKEETALITKPVDKIYGVGATEILLTAYARSLRKLYSAEQVVVGVENTGRQKLFDRADFGGTVGWFTATCPVVLTGDLVINKESLKGIPYDGIRYPFIKKNKPQFLFNYVGEVERESGYVRIELAERTDNYEEETFCLDAEIINGRLTLCLAVNGADQKDADFILDTIVQETKALVERREGQKTPCYSPSDFGMTGMPQEDFSEVLAAFSPRLPEEIAPLTFMQEGMLYHTLAAPDKKEYIEQEVVAFRGKADIGRIEFALRALTRRHAVLRTRYILCSSGNLWQASEKDASLPFRVAKGDWKEVAKEEEQRGINPLKELPMRTVLVEEEDRFILIWTSHHLTFDAWCSVPLFEDFAKVYHDSDSAAALEKEKEKETSFFEYARQLKKCDKRKNKAYWMTLLTGCVKTGLAPDGRTATGKVSERTKKLGEGYSVTDLSNEYSVTESMILEAATAIFMQTITGRTDVVFGKVISGRAVPIGGIENTIGLFINTVPVRITDKNAEDIIGSIRRQSLVADERGTCSLSEIYNELKITDPISLLYVNNGFADISEKEYESLLSRDSTNYDITLGIEERNGNFFVGIMYDEGLFAEEDILKMLSLFDNVVRSLADKTALHFDVVEPKTGVGDVVGKDFLPEREAITEVEKEVFDVVRQVADVSFGESFVNGGVSSLDRIRISVRLPKKYALTMEDVAKADSAYDLAKMAEKKGKRRFFLALKENGNKKAIFCVPYAGATGRIYQEFAALTTGFDVFSTTLCAYGEREMKGVCDEYVSLAERYEKVYVYAHCLGSFCALRLLSDGRRKADKALFGAHIPERISSVFGLPIDGWKNASDEKILSVLKKAGMSVEKDVGGAIAARFRADSSLSASIEAKFKGKIDVPSCVLLTEDDIFIKKDIGKATSRWEKFIDGKIVVKTVENGGHYFINDARFVSLIEEWFAND